MLMLYARIIIQYNMPSLHDDLVPRIPKFA